MKRNMFLIFLVIFAIFGSLYGQNKDKQNEIENLLKKGELFLKSKNYTKAMEIYKTAIRLEPYNPNLWEKYDIAVEKAFLKRKAESALFPWAEKKIEPTFSIVTVDTFFELGALYLVGEIKNISKKEKRNIEVTGYLINKEGQIIAEEKNLVEFAKQGVLPGETVPFEIKFKNPPKGIFKYRVKVTDYE